MNIVHTVTEGGQIATHRFRMFKQVLKIAFSCAFVVGLITFALCMLRVPFSHYQGVWYYTKATVLKSFVKQIEVDSQYWAFATGQRYAQASIVLPAERVISMSEPYLAAMERSSMYALKVSSMTSNFTAGVILFLFLCCGLRSKSKQHLSGKKMSPAWLVALRLKFTRNASPIRIGSVPLVKGTESRHILITGGTGTGKTNCLHHILQQLRAQKQKAVIVDTTGVFLERYYDPDKDVLLSPFHPQTARWHPWAECKTPFDFSEIAEAFIPHSYSEHDNYWRQASRTVFCSMLQKFDNSKKISELVRWILFETLSNMCLLLQGTKAASHMDINSEKTASSVRSVVSTFLECLECLEDTNNAFSIRDWISSDTQNSQGSQDSQDSWLFLHCNPDQRASARPLLSAWISSAIRGLMSLQPDLDRKIWFIIDELPTLQRVKDIEVLLAEGRKYGGCGILSLQSPSQLESIYGREVTETIIGNTQTKIVFSEQDPKIADRISKSFGDCEVKEFQEGISYGAHETRDGVNLSTHTKHAPVVSSSSIMALPKNTAFLKLPGSYPIAKVRLGIAKRD